MRRVVLQTRETRGARVRVIWGAVLETREARGALARVI